LDYFFVAFKSKSLLTKQIHLITGGIKILQTKLLKRS